MGIMAPGGRRGAGVEERRDRELERPVLLLRLGTAQILFLGAGHGEHKPDGRREQDGNDYMDDCLHAAPLNRFPRIPLSGFTILPIHNISLSPGKSFCCITCAVSAAVAFKPGHVQTDRRSAGADCRPRSE